MKIIKGLDEIRAAQTVTYPTHYDIYHRFPDYTAGIVSGIYNRKTDKWVLCYHETKEDMMDRYQQLQEICLQFPDVFEWSDYSEMVVWISHGYTKPKWALTYIVTEE